MKTRTKNEEKNSYLQSSKIRAKRNTYLNQVNMRNENKEQGITLIALVVTIVVDLVSYDKNKKYSNLVGFSL